VSFFERFEPPSRGTLVAIAAGVLHLSAARLALVVLGLGVVSSGCGNECSGGESTCEGGQIHTCDTSDDLYADWRGLGANCRPGSCIDVTTDAGLRAATCSTTGQLDPRCDAVTSSTPVCSGSTTLVCAYGYSTVTDGCAP